MVNKTAARWHVEEKDFPYRGTPEQKWQFLLQYAILAPSHRNMQPWHFQMSGDRLEFYVDWQKGVQGIDPQGRELVMSCGAALFHLRVAMSHFGLHPDIEVFPHLADRDLVARISLTGGKDVVEDQKTLFHAIPHRHTNRKPYDDRSIARKIVDRLHADARSENASLHFVESEHKRKELANLVSQGDRKQGASPLFRLDVSRVVKSNLSGAEEGIPGKALGYNLLQSLVMPAVLGRYDMSEEQAMDDMAAVASAPYIAVLCTREDDHQAWLDAGQALDRILLDATASGLSASFLAQPIELANLRPKLRELVGTGEHPQLILRLGYADEEAEPTPRRPVRKLRRG